MFICILSFSLVSCGDKNKTKESLTKFFDIYQNLN